MVTHEAANSPMAAQALTPASPAAAYALPPSSASRSTRRSSVDLTNSHNVRNGWKAEVDIGSTASAYTTLADFLSQPLLAVEVALPISLKGAWPWGSKVRTHFAALRTEGGTLLFHYGLGSDTLLNGIFDDNPYEGYNTVGTLALLSAGDVEGERAVLDAPRPMEAAEQLEMVRLDQLYPDAEPIYVNGETACEVSYTQTIRDGAFRFDVAGIRIYSSAATTIIERGHGGALECSVQS